MEHSDIDERCERCFSLGISAESGEINYIRQQIDIDQTAEIIDRKRTSESYNSLRDACIRCYESRIKEFDKKFAESAGIKL